MTLYQFWRMFQRMKTTARTRVKANIKDGESNKLCSNEQMGREFLKRYLQQTDQSSQCDRVATQDIYYNIVMYMEFEEAVTTKEARGLTGKAN